MPPVLKAPFPWFGGKSRAASLIWDRLGDVPNYVEPFAGSLAVLLSRPHAPRIETVNDKDGFISNFWRATIADPDAVAEWAEWPVNENDQHARHVWLVGQRGTLTARLEGDPEYYDAKIAGWWVWGICCWIGGGWCSGAGPWMVDDRKLVHLGSAGQGVHRKRDLVSWFQALRDRLLRVRVCCGDWSRVCGPTPTVKQGLTGVVLDPPYADTADRTADLYATDSLSVAHDVRAWAIANGDNPLLRIVLCGYDGEHAMPEGWARVSWKAQGGYGSQGQGAGRENAERETLWCSPHCRGGGADMPLFGPQEQST